MSEIDDRLEAPVSAPKDADLARCRQVAQQIQAGQDTIIKKQNELDAAKADLLRLSTVVLPAIMKEIGLTHFTMADGSTVSVAPQVYTHISEDRASEAFKWLREHNFGDIIKDNLIVSFGKGEDAKAQDLTRTLRENGYAFENKEGVHSSTLKAFVKERIKAGDPPPEDLFGIHIVDQAEITKKKEKKR